MKMSTRSRSFSCLLFFSSSLALFLLSPQSSMAQGRSKGGSTKEVYTGTILFIGGPRTVGTTTRTFTLTIDCYTPADEVRRLPEALKAGGQDGLLKAISHDKCGRIQIGSGV